MENRLWEEFRKRYHNEPLIASSPGRVNLIGEHTDYNMGFVLPGAIDKKMIAAVAENGKNELRVYANQFDQERSCSLADLHPSRGWITYLQGVVFFLKQKGYVVPGIDVIIDGDIPVGAGMSSSAALCSAFGFALSELLGLEVPRLELAFIGQLTEHQFAGVQCGIMDQFASLFGKAGHLIQLDCRSLEYEYIPFDFPDHKIVLINTMVSHSLAGSEYNTRRQQCEEGVALLQRFYPLARSLRDITTEQLNAHAHELPELVYRRCSFVVSENERLLQSVEWLRQGNLDAFGKLMFETHEGLSKKYEVSCPESDFLVQLALESGVVMGSRQMGGGFGGCTINIIPATEVDGFSDYVKKIYQQRFGRQPEIYINQIRKGASIEQVA